MGASFGAFDTTLVFAGSRRAAFRESAVAGSLELRPTTDLGVQFALGAIVGGRIELEGRSSDVRPGVVASVAGSYRLVDGRGAAPLILGTLSIAQSFASTRDPARGDHTALRATDVRLGVIVGKTLFDTLTPYLVGRVFGGPVSWKAPPVDRPDAARTSIVGTDLYKYQVGGGLVVVPGAGLDASVEVVVLGERRITAALGFAW